tara:strand:- start:57366 stop:58769 length:1404 start_codon:yes stop_codon:yes gene_type:complete
MEKFEKRLKLSDVYAICLGAMFSSGFFLLPGLAASETGPSVVLAYVLAAFLVLPSLMSIAELSTAMPKASGIFFFIDRALGPLMSTVGGISMWLALTFKGAFAFIGMQAYTSLFFSGDITPYAIGLTVIFGLLNLFGAKETAGMQKVLVAGLVIILSYFLVDAGVNTVFNSSVSEVKDGFSPFLTNGIDGIMQATAIVFVAFLGVSQLASVAEEVKDPARDIPRGIMYAVLTALVLMVLGVFFVVHFVELDELSKDLSPIATASEGAFTLIPSNWGLYLIFAAAMAAFASTANASIMSASRFPLAMGRDQILPSLFSKMNRFNTPTFSIILTVAVMVAFQLFLSPMSVAKFASVVQLIAFILVNCTLIVMRESKIEHYKPGFKTPFYPWMQILGIISSCLLLYYLGKRPLLISAALAIFCLLWFLFYVRSRAERKGAIFHIFHALGRHKDDKIHHDLKEINKEKGMT